MAEKSFLSQYGRWILALVCGIYIGVLCLNDGFMALDEYWVGIKRYIPSQTSSMFKLVGPNDVKSPLQILPMHGVARAALHLGVTSPYWQYRTVIFVIGGINFLLLLLAFLQFARLQNYSEREKNFLLLLLGFYFVAPFAFTRPMFESLGAPWLALAAVAALSYERRPALKSLLLGTCFASMAFILRQQLGICALIFVILPLWKKQWKHLAWVAAVGGGFFILSGLPDYFLRGQFHFSLIHLFTYNVEHGSDYGRQPLLFYPLVMIAVTFSPFLIAKYPPGFVREKFRQQRSLWIILFLFTFLHSLFPQKWERFIISVVPILMFIVMPYLYELQRNFSQHRIRLISLYSLNGLLFFVASFFPPQKNLISMSIFLDQHPEITHMYRIGNTPEWITEAFILQKNFEFLDIRDIDVTGFDWTDCHNALVLGENQRMALAGHLPETLHERAQFPVNFIEEISYRLNKEHNARRTKLTLYGCKN